MRKFAIILYLCRRDACGGTDVQSRIPYLFKSTLTKPEGPYTPIYSWFGYDESNYTTMKYGKQLLGELHDLSPVPVYYPGASSADLGQRSGGAEVEFVECIHARRERQAGVRLHHYRPDLRRISRMPVCGRWWSLGFMPKDLAATVPGVNDYQVHYPGSTISGASNNPPKDYAMWGELVRKYTEHLVAALRQRDRSAPGTSRCGTSRTLRTGMATPEEYFKLYDYAVAGVRAALPNAIVGGPASTGPASEKASAFLDNFLKHCLNDKSAANGKPIPLDFISFHPKGRPTVVDGHVRMGLANELKAAGEGFRIVAKYPKFIHLPIILSEADPEGCAACSMKVNPANAYRNGPLYATYTAAAIKGLFALQDRYKVNLISMLSWSFEFEDKEYFEGFRTLATNGVDKPVLNVFRMAGLMSGQRVSTSSTGQVPLDDILSSGSAADARCGRLRDEGRSMKPR